MHTRTVEQVRSWDSRPFDGGLDALSTLSDEGHTGAVVAADTWLFMLNGRVIGLFEGSMDDFEATGTVYATGHDSLPLLFSMQERDGRTRAKYFTEDTRLTEVDTTLADANFTGYVELSENVLSGDYYLVYYGGERRSAAFIGQSERVETGDAAFEKAIDEVGLYEVKDVSMSITEIPTPEPDQSAEAVTTSTGDATEASDPREKSHEPTSSDTPAAADSQAPDKPQAGSTEEPSPAEAEPATNHIDSVAETEASPTADDQTVPTEAAPEKSDTPDTMGTQTGTPESESTEVADSEPAAEPEPTADPDPAAEQRAGSSPPTTESATPAGTKAQKKATDAPREAKEAEREGATEPQREASEAQRGTTKANDEGGDSTPSVTDRRSGTQTRDTTTNSTANRSSVESASTSTAESARTAEPRSDAETEASDSDLDQMFRAEAEWRQTRAIPALDPDETASVDEDASGDSRESKSAATATGTTTDAGTESTAARSEEKPRSERSGSIVRADEIERDRSQAATSQSTEDDGRAAAKQKLESAIETRDERIDTLESRLAEAEDTRSELETQLETERERRAELEADLETMRSERDQLAARVEELEAAEPAVTGGTRESEMRPAEALSGTNLFVRYGSKSEPTLEAIEGEADPEAINRNLSLEHHTQFEADAVTVEDKPFREFLESTGAFRFADWVLRELPYELLETGNRQSLADLFEAISEIDRVEFDGSVTTDAESGDDSRFSLVMRDRMGNPLIVGEYTDRRNPVEGSELQALLDGGKAVADSSEHLAGAFYVTSSFFEPAALETAENAASSGGLFSRQEKASYVTPESGEGFHLGLIEDRSGAFHVTVPKL